MERIATGNISFEVEMTVDCLTNEFEDEICGRLNEIYVELDSESFLRKLLFDDKLQIVDTQVSFNEVD